MLIIIGSQSIKIQIIFVAFYLRSHFRSLRDLTTYTFTTSDVYRINAILRTLQHLLCSFLILLNTFVHTDSNSVLTRTTKCTCIRCTQRCSYTKAYALRMQILESVRKFQKNFLYALLTLPLDNRPLQTYEYPIHSV